MPDVDETETHNSPQALSYLNDLRQKLNRSYEILQKNKMFRMNRAKVYYDRNLRKQNYEIGDLVLCDQPKIQKGLSRGLAPRYYGPFQIVGKYKNGCDYLIKEYNKPRARIKQIHINRLITYHSRGHPNDENKISITPEQSQPLLQRRRYYKNPNCLRWQQNKNQNEQFDENTQKSASQASDSSSQSTKSNEFSSSSDESNKESEPPIIKRPRGRPPKNKNKELQFNKKEKEIKNTKNISRPHRAHKPPDRYDQNKQI
jgi:hypothetical protein